MRTLHFTSFFMRNENRNRIKIMFCHGEWIVPSSSRWSDFFFPTKEQHSKKLSLCVFDFVRVSIEWTDRHLIHVPVSVAKDTHLWELWENVSSERERESWENLWKFSLFTSSTHGFPRVFRERESGESALSHSSTVDSATLRGRSRSITCVVDVCRWRSFSFFRL